jgi:hypothetical protein
MIEILLKEGEKRRRNGGRRSTASMESRLLMTLEYLREYRTYFHVASTFEVSKSWRGFPRDVILKG